MRTLLIVLIAALAAMPLAASELPKQESNCNTPLMQVVEPATAPVGAVVTVTGNSLEKACLSGVFLSNSSGDLAVAILEQSSTTLRFKVPAGAKPGRFGLAVLNKEKTTLIDEPVFLIVQ